MATEEFYLPGNMTGISASESFDGPSEDGEANIAYESDRCVAAWLEYTVDNEGVTTTRKIPILPAPKVASHNVLPKGCTFVIKASVGNRGFFKGRVSC